MSIQFTCPSCSQPIEVDDEFADKQVVCPYCESVVAAPSRSNLDAAQRPNARPLESAPPPAPGAPTSAPQAAPAPYPAWQPPVLERNRLGNWALTFSILAWILMGIMMFYSAMVMISLLPEGARELSQQELKQKVDAATTQFAESPELASKRAVVAAIQWSGVAVGLIAMVLAIAGMTRRNARKGSSIAALVISIPMLLCILFGVAALAMKGAAGS